MPGNIECSSSPVAYQGLFDVTVSMKDIVCAFLLQRREIYNTSKRRICQPIQFTSVKYIKNHYLGRDMAILENGYRKT